MKSIRHFLLALMLMCGFTASAESDYGLVDSIQGGVILHCYGWTYQQITENLTKIAEAGFTAVQTLPVQVIDVSTSDGTPDNLYEGPIGLALSYDESKFSTDDDDAFNEEIDYYDSEDEFYSSFHPLGSPDELKTLCDSAHSLGIFVIVEINANGLYRKGLVYQTSLSEDSCWHTLGTALETNRYNVTYRDVEDLSDLATEKEYVQQCVIQFLKELDSIGVDGIRWYQARDISLPSEDFTEYDTLAVSSNFWPAVTTNSGLNLYNYTVFYDRMSEDHNDDYLIEEQYTKYLSINDDEYSDDVIQGFASGDIVTNYANLTASSDYDIPNNRIVYLPESPNTYYMDPSKPEYTGDLSQNIADRAWAVLASHNDLSALYFVRPLEDEGEDVYIGDNCNTHFTSPEVAQVNILHNICNGEPDYFTSSDNVISICRESGAVLVLAKDSNQLVTAVNGGNYTTPGTYTDKISGNTFTVTEDSITGTIGSTGIAVLYSDSALNPKIILDPNGGNFSNTITVTAHLNNTAISGTLQVGDGETQTITEKTTVTLGEDMSIGDSVTIYWTATDGTQTKSGSSIYIKINPKTIRIFVYNNSSEVSDAPHIYAWIDGTVAIEKTEEWPGSKMQRSYGIGSKYFWMEEIENVDSYVNIILNDSLENGDLLQTSNITGIDEDAYFLYNDSTEYEIITPPSILPDTTINQPLFVYLVNNAYYDSLTVSIWDKDNNYFTNKDGNKLTHCVSKYDDYGTYYYVYKWSYDGTLTSTPTSLTFTGVNNSNESVTSDTLKFHNGGWYSNAKTWFGSQGKVFRTLQVIYDEETANGYYNTNILSSDEELELSSTLVRELDKSYWNTICLPFDVRVDTIIKVCGEGTDIEQFDSVVGTTLYFTEMGDSIIKAGVPYLIKPGNDTVTNPVFYNPEIYPTSYATSVEKQNAKGDKYKFTGTYSPCALDTLTDMFLSKDGGLLHPTSTDYTIKGLRAYITLPDSSTTAAAVSFEPLISTGINRVDTDDDNDADADIYNISGQKVNSDISTLPQGIYITRGRKFIIK